MCLVSLNSCGGSARRGHMRTRRGRGTNGKTKDGLRYGIEVKGLKRKKGGQKDCSGPSTCGRRGGGGGECKNGQNLQRLGRGEKHL